jgi:hypothetical protein
VSAYLNASTLSTDQLMLSPPDEARVLVRAASTMIKGVLAGTPSYIRVPSGTKFQQVHALRLEKGLTEGDCGAAVFGEGTDQLLGHIVAGCRSDSSTGFAYVIAAEHVIPELEKFAEKATEPSVGTTLGQPSDQASPH